MKKLMLIGATIVVGLVVFATLQAYVDISAGSGRVWSLQQQPGLMGMDGEWYENYRVEDATGQVISISFTCVKANQLCWQIMGDGSILRTYGIGEFPSDPTLPSSGSGTLETN